jgi:hypothetical protein
MSNNPHVVMSERDFGGLGVAEQLATSLLNAKDVAAPVRTTPHHSLQALANKKHSTSP